MRLNRITIVFALALAAGCTKDNPEQPVGGVGGGGTVSTPTACASNADCSGGQICTSIGCCPGCHSDVDCAADSTCVAGSPNFCAPKHTTGGNTKPPVVVDNHPVTPNTNVPKNCSADADCGTGRVCIEGACRNACTANSQCPSGAVCSNGRCYSNGGGGGGGGLCGIGDLIACTLSGECGTGRLCISGQCAAQCTAASDCGIGQACGQGLCADATPAKAECIWDADCGSASRCINASCHPLCSADAQCPAHNACVAGVCRANTFPTI